MLRGNGGQSIFSVPSTIDLFITCSQKLPNALIKGNAETNENLPGLILYKPTISILMPVHNNESSLAECLESIRRQTINDFELVIVDDGSTDNSENMLAHHAGQDKRIKLIRQSRKGIVEALNRGLQDCEGRYIARMDGDDWMHPHRLQRQLQFFEEHRGLDLIGSRVEGLPTTTDYQKWSNALITDEEIKEEMFVESPIMHPTFFAKRMLFDQLGGYRQNPWAEDYDFILRAYQQNLRFAKVDEVLVKKNDSPTRLSRVDWKYKRPAMFRAKVHYFLQCGFLNKKKGVVIAGTGPSGRNIASFFREKGIAVLGFTDNRPSPPNRTVMGIPAWGIDESLPDELLSLMEETYVILAIGGKNGYQQWVQLMNRHALRNAIEFKRFL